MNTSDGGRCRLWTAVAVGSAVLSLCLIPAARGTLAETTPGYQLRYRFQPGEELQWQVTHRARVRTTVAQTEQTAETLSRSTKTWRILDVDASGAAKFELRVDNVEMTHRISDGKEIRYDSCSGDPPPAGFADVGKTIGKPLAIITLSPSGEVVERKQLEPEALQTQGYLTVPFPQNLVAIGESWMVPDEITVPLRNGTVKKIQIRQKFTLEDVKNDIAIIRIGTQVLTPINDPEVEVQLVQRLSEGTVRFDISAGRIIAQEIEVDRQVVGFQGEASAFHYQTRFTEEFLHSRVARSGKQEQTKER
ncbi:MAG: hypothetical protein ACUVQG_11555 [Thermogutta sp.]